MGRLRPEVFHSILVIVLCCVMGFVQPGMTGFYCDDRTIQRPFNGDTVSLWSLAFVVLLFPLLAIALVESLRTLSSSNSWWKSALKIFYKYVVGLMLMFAILEILKIYVAELRPHFLDTCRPNVTVEECTGEFVSNYVCTNNNATWRQILDSRKSFPSGHAAGACFASLFLAIYVHIRIEWGPWILRPWLQVVFLAWAAFCSVSRIVDFRHHWWDVLFGAGVGLSGAVYTVNILCNKFNNACRAASVAPSNDHNNKQEVPTYVRCVTSSSSKSGPVPKDNNSSSTV